MSTAPKFFPLDQDYEDALTFKEIITQEIYSHIVAGVVYKIAEDILQHQRCVVCRETLVERVEGQILATDQCWFKRHADSTGHYYCKNSPGTLLSPDVKITPQGIETVGIQSPPDLPFEVSGTTVVKAEIGSDKGLTVKIDAPSYTPSDVKIFMSKTDFTEYYISVVMDNEYKGTKEVTFKISATLYDPQGYATSATIENGLITIHFPRREPFGIKTLHIKGSSGIGNLSFPSK